MSIVGCFDHMPEVFIEFYPYLELAFIEFFCRPPLSSLSYSSVKLSYESLKLKADRIVISFLGLVYISVGLAPSSLISSGRNAT